MNEAGFSVIHLSTGHMGGAGLAARRLNQKLNEQNVDSRFYALKHEDFQPSLNEYDIYRPFAKRFTSQVISYLDGKLSSKVFFSPFSIDTLPENFAKNILNKKTTILHIHNWFNLVNFQHISRLSKLGFPIALTLHDQRTMTGGCHYSLGCTNFERDCAKCPELNLLQNAIPKIIWRKNTRSLGGLGDKFALIAPSNWILQEAKKSSLLKDKRIEFIPNTLGTFFPKIEVKKSPTTVEVKLGIASMHSNSYIKGGDLVLQLEKIVRNENLPFKFIFLNSFEQNMAGVTNFWQNIDYLLVLSRAENSPNVIHEAKQIGIPVIASKIGGITELLSEGFDIGIDEDDLNPPRILELILKIPKMLTNDSRRKQMQNQFNEYSDASFAGHVTLYKELTGNN